MWAGVAHHSQGRLVSATPGARAPTRAVRNTAVHMTCDSDDTLTGIMSQCPTALNYEDTNGGGHHPNTTAVFN